MERRRLVLARLTGGDNSDNGGRLRTAVCPRPPHPPRGATGETEVPVECLVLSCPASLPFYSSGHDDASACQREAGHCPE